MKEWNGNKSSVYATIGYCAIHNEYMNKNIGDLTKLEIKKL